MSESDKNNFAEEKEQKEVCRRPSVHFYIVRQFNDELEGFEFWLCPALLAFFPEAPLEIFVKVISSQ